MASLRGRHMVTSDKPLNVGELIEALSLFPPGRTVYVGVLGASWTKPTRVRFGNAHNPSGLFVTIDNGTKDDR